MGTKLAVKPTGNAPDSTKSSWQSKLGEYVHQLSVLKVLTYVGDATVTLTDAGIVNTIEVSAVGKPIVTVLDLVGGDITTVIPAEFKDDTTMREFHELQVNKGATVLPNNLRTLGEIINKIF